MNTIASKAAVVVGRMLFSVGTMVIVTYGIPAVVSGVKVTSTYVKAQAHRIKNEVEVRNEMKNFNAELQTVLK